MNHPQCGAFFTRFEDLEVGVKIGEGGQPEIFAASSPSFKPWNGYKPPPLVAKVFKESVSQLLKEPINGLFLIFMEEHL